MEALEGAHEQKHENWSFRAEQPGRAAWWVIIWSSRSRWLRKLPRYFGICPTYPIFFFRLHEPHIYSFYHLLYFLRWFLQRKPDSRAIIVVIFYLVKGEGLISLDLEKNSPNPICISLQSYSCFIMSLSLCFLVLCSGSQLD